MLLPQLRLYLIPLKEPIMSFWRTYYHLVWATYDRRPLIDSAVERHLFPYLEKKAHEFQTVVYALNGVEDHIHLVAAILSLIHI